MSSILFSKVYAGVTAELLEDNDNGTARVRLIDVGDRYYEGPSSGDELTVTLSEWTQEPDIRPGDRVTVLLHSDWWTRTSTVVKDGSYVGCGAVEKGRAAIIRIRAAG